jgi:putative ABC transport system ATP-binding protein
MIEFINVSKKFSSEPEPIDVLKNVSFSVKSGEFVAIMGPSGSGKSTLLGIAAGLDKPDVGVVSFDGIDLVKENESSLANIRAKSIGFIFQNFQLLPGMNALENVGIPLYLTSNMSEKQILEKSLDLLSSVSMQHRAGHFPKQLSGGEEQRIAIARAFINEPKVIFADEPTANLDSKNSKVVLDLLLERNKKLNTTLIIVTHDPAVAKLADRILEMRDGEILNSKNSETKFKSVSRSKQPKKKSNKSRKV